MIVLLSCAKTMSGSSKITTPFETMPRFRQEASEIALQMSQFSVEDLERILRVNSKIAVENYNAIRLFTRRELQNCLLFWLIQELCLSV